MLAPRGTFAFNPFEAGAAATGGPYELLICLTYDCVLGPYLGVPEPISCRSCGSWSAASGGVWKVLQADLDGLPRRRTEQSPTAGAG
jgi:hypothetical protein